jgi:hypothetical protein
MKKVEEQEVATILWDIKAGTPGYQEQEDGSVKPTVIPYEFEMNDIDISEILVPSVKHLPNWYKLLNKKKDFQHEQTLSIKTCVSFLTLFQNSYLFLSPIDFQLKVSRLGYEVITDKNQKHSNFTRIVSHTHSDVETAIRQGHLESQLGPYFNKNYMNIKLDTAMCIRSKKGRIDLVHMHPFYWTPDSPLQAMQGILPIIDTYDVGFNINMMCRRDKAFTMTIKKGTPLAMYYSPNGLINFEKAEIKQNLPELGKYPIETKKCPYFHNNTEK